MTETTKRLNRVKKRVERILTDFYESRDDDRLLYYLVCKEVCEERGVDINQEPFSIILSDVLPSYESVRRSRAKIQSENKNLWGDKKLKRDELQEDWIESELV